MHILDIAENSIEACAKTIEIRLEENSSKDLLTLEIADDGQGMDEATLHSALDPFFTTKKTRRVGFGLSLLAEAARAANGRFKIQSEPGKGATVRASFQLSHIDRQPLGDIPQTLATLIAGHPEVDIVYVHVVDGAEYSMDTREVKTGLDGLTINSPNIIRFIRNHIKDGLDQIRR